jgi:UDP-2,3-diacylglucosamine pyrophosphatase LpxH
LTRIFETAWRLPVDDRSRILFLSDSHRGDGGPADDLWPNRRLYQDVLTHYFREGFTYIEVGDGDELWKNRRIAPILRAHRSTYDLLHEYHERERLHLIMGNHDYAHPRLRLIAKEGIPAHEGLVLQVNGTGQDLLVIHGHQVDFARDPGLTFSRLGVRHFWRGLQTRGIWCNPSWTELAQGRSRLGRVIARGMLNRNDSVEARLTSWLIHPSTNGHGRALLCGHTHVPRLAASGEPAYFNTGCCIVPGQITGLELQEGQLSLVKWTGEQDLERELLAGPRPLSKLT